MEYTLDGIYNEIRDQQLKSSILRFKEISHIEVSNEVYHNLRATPNGAVREDRATGEITLLGFEIVAVKRARDPKHFIVRFKS